MVDYKTNRKTRGVFLTGTQQIHPASDYAGEFIRQDIPWTEERIDLWRIRSSSGDTLEELSIETSEGKGTPYEIVNHDFISGDIETVDYARTYRSARKKVTKFLKENPKGAYNTTIRKISSEGIY
jgi:hypothetical protein